MRAILMMVVAASLSACAAAKSTPAQERAQAAWDACAAEGRIAAGLMLSRIDPDGRLWFRTASDGTIGWAELRACLAEKRQTLPR